MQIVEKIITNTLNVFFQIIIGVPLSIPFSTQQKNYLILTIPQKKQTLQ